MPAKTLAHEPGSTHEHDACCAYCGEEFTRFDLRNTLQSGARTPHGAVFKRDLHHECVRDFVANGKRPRALETEGAK